MFEQHTRDLDHSLLHHVSRAVPGQHIHDLNRPIEFGAKFCRFVEWGSAILVLCTHTRVRARPRPPIFCRFVRWGSVVLVIHTYGRTMLEQHTHDHCRPVEFESPMFCGATLPVRRDKPATWRRRQ